MAGRCNKVKNISHYLVSHQVNQVVFLSPRHGTHPGATQLGKEPRKILLVFRCAGEVSVSRTSRHTFIEHGNNDPAPTTCFTNANITLHLCTPTSPSGSATPLIFLVVRPDLTLHLDARNQAGILALNDKLWLVSNFMFTRQWEISTRLRIKDAQPGLQDDVNHDDGGHREHRLLPVLNICLDAGRPVVFRWRLFANYMPSGGLAGQRICDRRGIRSIVQMERQNDGRGDLR